MKLTTLLCLIGLSLSSEALLAEASKTELRDRAAEFLRKNVAGKRLVGQKINTVTKEGNYEYEFQRNTYISDVRTSEKGLSFIVTYHVSQKNYDIDANKKRIPGKVRVEDRILTQEYRLRTLESTGKLVGVRWTASSSLADSYGTADSAIIEMTDDSLILKTKTVAYTDHFAAEGKYYPGVTENVVTASRKNDVTTWVEEVIASRVNPDTFEVVSSEEKEAYTDTEAK